jgi:hypothetical protein
MSNDSGLIPQPSAKIQHFQFEGDTLIAILIEGEGVAVPIRVVCDALGIDLDTQSQRLREHEVLSRGLRVVRAPVEGRVRSVMALHLKYLGFWLATITPGLVREDVRPKLVIYQLELVEIISRLFTPQASDAITPPASGTLSPLEQRLIEAINEVRLAREAILASRQETQQELQGQSARIIVIEGLLDEIQARLAQEPISAAQQAVIKNAIQMLADRYKKRTQRDIFARLFTEFSIELGTPKYAMLPAGKYEAALEWIRRKAASLLPDEPDVIPPLQETFL